MSPRLPIEIWRQIFGFALDDIPDIDVVPAHQPFPTIHPGLVATPTHLSTAYSICLVSRDWHQIGAELLYHTVVVQHEHAEDILKALRRPNINGRSLGACVMELFFTFEPAIYLLDILARCRNIRYLRVSNSMATVNTNDRLDLDFNFLERIDWMGTPSNAFYSVVLRSPNLRHLFMGPSMHSLFEGVHVDRTASPVLCPSLQIFQSYNFPNQLSSSVVRPGDFPSVSHVIMSAITLNAVLRPDPLILQQLGPQISILELYSPHHTVITSMEDIATLLPNLQELRFTVCKQSFAVTDTLRSTIRTLQVRIPPKAFVSHGPPLEGFAFIEEALVQCLDSFCSTVNFPHLSEVVLHDEEDHLSSSQRIPSLMTLRPSFKLKRSDGRLLYGGPD
ncbi:hypothetical protein HGRIS_010033 [Hohenbuehelia grisea]|uniref:F-box domain-containing protein n=1 Tax=Hohenbuehelia grisea TaxID=104357 RepID=A0ABR3J3J1_9AGAR